MRKCEHGEPIPASSPRAMRAPACLLCHAGFLAEAAKRSHLFRAEMNEEERQAFLEYQREWGKRNRAEHSARRRPARTTSVSLTYGRPHGKSSRCRVLTDPALSIALAPR